MRGATNLVATNQAAIKETGSTTTPTNEFSISKKKLSTLITAPSTKTWLSVLTNASCCGRDAWE